MSELDVQVARQDERIQAIREELRAGFSRLEGALREHSAEDRAAHNRISALEARDNRMAGAWKFAIILALSVSGAVEMISHLWVFAHP
jgi:hypothetical protein